jgi:hypothetical protein
MNLHLLCPFDEFRRRGRLVMMQFHAADVMPFALGLSSVTFWCAVLATPRVTEDPAVALSEDQPIKEPGLPFCQVFPLSRAGILVAVAVFGPGHARGRLVLRWVALLRSTRPE